MYLLKKLSLNDQNTSSTLDTSKSSTSYPVVIRDNKDGKVLLSKLKPSIKVPFYGIIGSVSSVRKLKSGDWHVECKSKEQQTNLLSTNNLAGVSISSYIPTPRSEGIVYGLKDPLALCHHPDVIKFQVISNNKNAQTYTTRIVFGFDSLPTKLLTEKSEFEVYPFHPPHKRCTNCQSLSHTKRECTNTMRCSRCGGNHRRNGCTAQKPKCVNCHGSHSAAYRQCPMLSDPNNVSVNCSEFETPSKNIMSKQSYADKVKYTPPSLPSFITFITSVVIPILTLNRNINIINQLLKVYNEFLGLDIKLSIQDRISVENLLDQKTLATETREDKSHEDLDIASMPTSSSLSSKETVQRKQVTELKNLNIKTGTRNIVIGDSTTKGISDDNSTSTQVFCIPGLNIDDVQEWLISPDKLNMNNVIFHVGVNSCRKKTHHFKDMDRHYKQGKV